ncbi:type II toxin-antitoxin system RelE/ParE family toxin [Tateyamaria sp.]|uniref:type II toxin-antitoxin system RelE/ParE family toxin n=1 Tax=Tateyamaria sp. TaxID=1929288 RepID=UPI00329D5B8C
MTAYLLTPAARADLDDIWDYTETTWGLAQAETYLRAIDAACAGLATQVTVNQSAEHIRAGYRKAFCGRHVLYYRQNDGDTIVVRILHQRMDVDAHLF